ncbi:MAG: tetratricopeptide repeat protein [Elusimicrobiota bacterium]
MADDERRRLSCWLGESAGADAPSSEPAAAGEALLRAGDLDGALSAFDRAAAGSPGNPWVYLSRAAVRYRFGEFDLAERDLDAYRRLRPDGAAGPAVAAMLGAARGDSAAALASADAAVAASGNAAWALALRGTLRGRCGLLDDSRADLDAALARETLPWALAARADTLNRIGYFWLSLEDLDRLRELLPGDPEPDVIAAGIHRDQAQYAEALTRLARAEALRPADARFSRLRSEVLFVEGKIDAALRELGRARKLAPADLQLRFERVRLLALARRDAEAEKELAGYGLPPAQRDYLLGYLRARAKRWKEAEKLFDRVARDFGPDAGHLRERAVLYRQVARLMPRLRKPALPKTKEFRMTGLGYRQPIQTTVDALRFMSTCDAIYSNLSDASVVDFVGLFGLPFRAIVFRRMDQEAFKAAADVMPGFRGNRVVGVVTRGHPLFYGRLARRVAELCWKRGYSVRVVAATSIADSIPMFVGRPAEPMLGLEVRDALDMDGLDPRLPLILYNFPTRPEMRAIVARRLAEGRSPADPVYLLAGYGSREFAPVVADLGGLEAELNRADEAVTLYLPARARP